MAHFIFEYSNNLDLDVLDVSGLFRKLHEAAAASGVFPLAGVRSRAVGYDEFRVADGDAQNAFVNLSVKVGGGRDVATRKQVGERFFNVLTTHLQPLFDSRYLAISFEMRELDAQVKFNKNNLRAKLQAKS